MKVNVYPHNILTKSVGKWDFDNQTYEGEKIIEDCIFDMILFLENNSNAAAIAANQLKLLNNVVHEHNMNVFVVSEKISKKYDIPRYLINAEISEQDKNFKVENEGCLSFPGIHIPVARCERIVCDFFTLDGSKRTVEVKDFAARVFQHEIEHLNGKVFIDNLPRIKKFKIIESMRKLK